MATVKALYGKTAQFILLASCLACATARGAAVVSDTGTPGGSDV